MLVLRVLAFFVEYLMEERVRNDSVFGESAGVEGLRCVGVRRDLRAARSEVLFRPLEQQRQLLVWGCSFSRRIARRLSSLFILHLVFEQQVSREDFVFSEAVIVEGDSMVVVLDVEVWEVDLQGERVRYVRWNLRPVSFLNLVSDQVRILFDRV